MNGAQQVERFTAVSRVEKRCDDVELIVTNLAVQLINDRRTIAEDLQVFNERLRVYAEREAERLDATDAIHANRLDAFEQMTFWQRLRWIVRGV